MGLTYDAGALIAADRNDRRMWALHRRALQRRERPTVPAGALAQVWRAGGQANLARLLKGCTVEALDGDGARAAGAACARSGTDDPIDASVVVSALTRGDAVLTSDPADLRRVAQGLGRRLAIHAV
jgi:hypothetical protein